MLFICKMPTASFLNYIQTIPRFKQLINHQHLAQGSKYKERMRQVICLLPSSKLTLASEQSSKVKEAAMDPQKVKEILDLKLKNINPPSFTKNQHYVLKQGAESYQLKGKANHTTEQ